MASSHHPDDPKYIQKYNELKRKVKEIEIVCFFLPHVSLLYRCLQDNDRLQVKVLKTKKNIQRLRIERAYVLPISFFVFLSLSYNVPSILYDRLASMPPADPHVQSGSYPYPDHPPHPADAFHAVPPPQPIDKDRRRLPPSPPLRPPSPIPRMEHYPAGPPPSHPHMPMETDHPSPPRRSRRHPDQHTPTLPPASVNYPIPRSPHTDDRLHGYPGYATYHLSRRDLGGPGLPPMRTHPEAPHSHNGYTHPTPHPYPPPDEHGWERERERDFAFPPIRDREPIPNGYPGPPPHPPHPPGPHSHRYDGPPHAHPPPQNGSPEAIYSGRPRRTSQSSVREYPLPPPPPVSHAYDYEYDRRRSFAEISDERGDREQERRNSIDEYEARRRERDDTVPRVREGEPMD